MQGPFRYLNQYSKRFLHFRLDWNTGIYYTVLYCTIPGTVLCTQILGDQHDQIGFRPTRQTRPTTLAAPTCRTCRSTPWPSPHPYSSCWSSCIRPFGRKWSSRWRIAPSISSEASPSAGTPTVRPRAAGPARAVAVEPLAVRSAPPLARHLRPPPCRPMRTLPHFPLDFFCALPPAPLPHHLRHCLRRRHRMASTRQLPPPRQLLPWPLQLLSSPSMR